MGRRIVRYFRFRAFDLYQEWLLQQIEFSVRGCVGGDESLNLSLWNDETTLLMALVSNKISCKSTGRSTQGHPFVYRRQLSPYYATHDSVINHPVRHKLDRGSKTKEIRSRKLFLQGQITVLYGIDKE